MTATRRQILGAGGMLIAALLPSRLPAQPVIDIRMQGRSDGSHVWYDPIGLRIEPGQTLRWTNEDAGNAHTATAYHPSVLDRPRRIPESASPWNSDYLLPGESFSVTLREPGVYDYYCIPHEHAGMVGRIIVGDPGERMGEDRGVPEAALSAFPTIEEIMSKGIVRRV